MATPHETMVQDALNLLPSTGEVEFDIFKQQLYAQNPDKGKEIFMDIMKNKRANRRVDVHARPPVVYLSRKGG